MTSGKRILLMGGIALVLVGMAFGLGYAVSAEHQALDEIGMSLAGSFKAAANRQPADIAHGMAHYREARYRYDRNVDAHGHWLGLAMVLIVLAIGFDYVIYPEKQKRVLAWALLSGSALFPSAVVLQTYTHAAGPRILAILGSGLVMMGLMVALAGVLRRPTTL